MVSKKDPMYGRGIKQPPIFQGYDSDEDEARHRKIAEAPDYSSCFVRGAEIGVKLSNLQTMADDFRNDPVGLAQSNYKQIEDLAYEVYALIKKNGCNTNSTSNADMTSDIIDTIIEAGTKISTLNWGDVSSKTGYLITAITG